MWTATVALRNRQATLRAFSEVARAQDRWFGDEDIEVVVDQSDGRVVTVWRKGLKP